ncbi:MAG: hypothetical protein ACUVX8_15305 [Candidatus Zipacnadales bacterium]
MTHDPLGCSNRCPMRINRRRFFRTAAAATASVTMIGVSDRFATASDAARPTVRLVFLRPAGKYWLGWPGTAYDIEGHRQQFTEDIVAAGKAVGVDVLPNLEPLYDDEALASFLRRCQANPPDAVIATLLHMNHWGHALKIAELDIPCIIFAPIGTSFTGHTQGISRQTGVNVVSALEGADLLFPLKMVRTAFDLRRQRILRVAGDERSDSVLDTLGIAVRHIPRRMFHELFEQTPETPAVRALANEVAAGAQAVREPSRTDLLNAARTYFTIKELLAREDATAAAIDCLGMVGARLVPTPPCMAFSRLNDERITAACEADLMAAVGLMFVSHLFDRPGFMQDPVWESTHNYWIGAHCTCATRLDGFDKPRSPYILRNHAESALGVAMQVLWRPGQVFTMVDFQSPNSVIVDRGTVVGNIDTPPAGGCRTSVLCNIDTIGEARDVQGFHQVMFYGDYLQQVRDYCQLYGITARTSAGV